VKKSFHLSALPSMLPSHQIVSLMVDDKLKRASTPWSV